MTREPLANIPPHLLYSGYRWESLRMRYYQRLGRMAEANDCAVLRDQYRAKIDGAGATV